MKESHPENPHRTPEAPSSGVRTLEPVSMMVVNKPWWQRLDGVALAVGVATALFMGLAGDLTPSAGERLMTLGRGSGNLTDAMIVAFGATTGIVMSAMALSLNESRKILSICALCVSAACMAMVAYQLNEVGLLGSVRGS